MEENNPKVETVYGNPTEDKVFILSTSEAEKYFTTDEARICKATAYAHSVASSEGGEAVSGKSCFWWLRSPGPYQTTTVFITQYGGIIGSGDYILNVGNSQVVGADVDSDNVCIRPAMWIEVG